MNKKQKKLRNMGRSHNKAPGWIRNGTIGVYDADKLRKFDNSKLGKFGAASDVRIIDPKDYVPGKPVPK